MTNERIEQIEADLRLIKARNASVEVDKAWETSLFRRLLIAFFTYLMIGGYLWAIRIDRPWLNAIVPTIGFMLSTLTLPFFKKLWINSNNKKEKHGKK